MDKNWNIEWVDGDTFKSWVDGCPNCGSKNMCFLPDLKHIPMKDNVGSVSVKTWECWNCKTYIMDTERKFDIDTVKGATAYLESEGFDVDECVKDGMKVINSIKDKLSTKNRSL